MDWLKLFALLVAVVSVSIKAEGPKKKIRIHLPQKVKHIHHHKKIYITNHPASSQYAPAYLPSAEGSVAVPTSVLPAVSHLMPINDIYDDHQDRVPNHSPAASHLLPLYHARGYYGPTHTEIEEHEYDLTPSEPADNYAPSGFSASVPVAQSHSPKRVKIIKLGEPPRKKIVKKSKPKRIPGRRRPASPVPLIEGEHPVSTFHEQFYSDVDGAATIRKVRKPPRVEKIIDGDTEHIHTYSEEHIHKVLFDGNSKLQNLVGVDPIAAYARPAAAYPFKGGQAIIAIPRHPYSLAALGTMATPAHFEYAAYNPREVTHDHIYHDHGEIPSGLDITKDPMSLPPKVSYNGQGIRLGSLKNIPKVKTAKYKKPLKPVTNDYSYYEGIYTDNNRQKKLARPSITTSGFEATAEEGNYRSLPDVGFKNSNSKVRNQLPSYYGKAPNDFRVQPSSVSSPFSSVSSNIVHDYKSNNFVNAGSAPGTVSKFKDPFVNFKDNYANNFEYDTFASSSNVYASEDKNDSGSFTLSRDKKKSISTQNMSFGGKDHVTYINHLGNDPAMISDDTPTALDNLDLFDQTQSSNIVTPTALTYKSSSPIHDIVSYLNSKSIQDQPISLPEASNNNFQYAEAPTQSTTPFPSSVATTPTQSPSYISHQNKDASERQITESREGKNLREANRHLYNQNNNPNTVRGKLKYGDKL